MTAAGDSTRLEMLLRREFKRFADTFSDTSRTFSRLTGNNTLFMHARGVQYAGRATLALQCSIANEVNCTNETLPNKNPATKSYFEDATSITCHRFNSCLEFDFGLRGASCPMYKTSVVRWKLSFRSSTAVCRWLKSDWLVVASAIDIRLEFAASLVRTV